MRRATSLRAADTHPSRLRSVASRSDLGHPLIEIRQTRIRLARRAQQRPVVQHLQLTPQQVAAFRYLPLYTRQESLRPLLRGRTESGQRPTITERGFMKTAHANPHDVATDAREYLDFTRAHSFTMSAENRQALDTIAALADRYHFDVSLANAPLYSGVYEDDASAPTTLR